MKKNIRIATAVLSLSILLSGGNAYAESACAFLNMPVNMMLSTDIGSTVPSATIGFKASIDNQATTTISDAVLAIDVVKHTSSADTIVDRFLVPQHVTVFSKFESVNDFDWVVPSGLSSGIYAVNATLVPAQGSIARAHVRGGYPTTAAQVEVKSGPDPAARVASISVNGQLYTPGSFAKTSSTGSLISVTVHNDSSGPYIGHLTWKLYAADAGVESLPISERTDPVELHPGTDGTVSYQIAAGDENSYYLEAMLDDGSQHTFFDVLLGTDTTAFPWITCLRRLETRSQDAVRYGTALIVLIILAAAAYMQYRRRWYRHGKKR